MEFETIEIQGVMMKILLATPYLSSHHLDSGLFWAAAASRLGHHVQLWDYRLEEGIHPFQFDLALVMKGSLKEAVAVGHNYTVLYWPDDFTRDWEITDKLRRQYSLTVTPVRPTPRGCLWIPTGFDPLVHTRRGTSQPNPSVFIGTGTERKATFIKAMAPSVVCGNDWQEQGIKAHPPIYLWEYIDLLSQTQVSINLHRSGTVGVNRRLFESIACTFTITDIVPGVEEIIGPVLTQKVGFRTPEEGKEKLDYYLLRQAQREILWREERQAIRSYTYENALKRIIAEVNL